MPAKEHPPYWLPAEHSMDRRHHVNDYHIGQKAYMVTLKTEGMTPLFGSVEESPDPSRIAECRLTPLGEAMRHAWLTLPERFPNIAVADSPDEYVIMPEHFHGIIYVVGYMQEHLSDIVRLFKARVAMSYRKLLIEGATRPVGTANDWLQAYQALPPQQQAAARQWVEAQLPALYSATRRGTQTGATAAATAASTASEQQRLGPSPIRVAASGSHGKRGFLFATGYTDSLLLDGDNLQGHRRYILDNPRSRWLRSHNRALLRVDRTGIDTAVSITALEKYLRKECLPRDVSDDKLAMVRSLLLYSATRRGTQQQTTGAAQQTTGAAQPARRWIECQSYGDRALLQRRLLPVVCHRKDAALLHLQKARCLKEAEDGAVMVSACISQAEREIITAVMEAGYPVVRIEDNGFPEIYHPSQSRTALCASQRLLIVSPWQYHYRHNDEAIFVAYCKTMNCIAQALCRCKDNWWNPVPAARPTVAPRAEQGMTISNNK